MSIKLGNKAITTRVNVKRVSSEGLFVTPKTVEISGLYGAMASQGYVYAIEVPKFRVKGEATEASEYVNWHTKMGAILRSKGHRSLPSRVAWRDAKGGGYILASTMLLPDLFAKFGMTLSNSDIEYMNLYREKSGALLARETKDWSFIPTVNVGIIYAEESHGLTMDGPLWIAQSSKIVTYWNDQRVELGLDPSVVGDNIQVAGRHIGPGFSALKGLCKIVDDDFIINHINKLKSDGASTFGYETLSLDVLKEMVWSTDMSAKRSADVFADRPDYDPRMFTYSFGVHTWGPDRVKFGGTLGAQMLERLLDVDPDVISEFGYRSGEKIRNIVNAVIEHTAGNGDLIIDLLSKKVDLRTLSTIDDAAVLVQASHVLGITRNLDLAYGSSEKLQDAINAAIKVALKERVEDRYSYRAYAESEYMYRSEGGVSLRDDQVAIGSAWHTIEGKVCTDDDGTLYKWAIVKRSPMLSHRAALKVKLIVGLDTLTSVVLPMSNQGTSTSYIAAAAMACDFDGDMLDVFTLPSIVDAKSPNTQSDWDFLSSYSSVSLGYLIRTTWVKGWTDGHSSMIKEFFVGRCASIASLSSINLHRIKTTRTWQELASYIMGSLLRINPEKGGELFTTIFGDTMVRQDSTMRKDTPTLYRAIRCENLGSKVGMMDNIVHQLAVASIPAGVLELHRVQGIISAVKHAKNGGIDVDSLLTDDNIVFIGGFKKQKAVTSWDKDAGRAVRDDKILPSMPSDILGDDVSGAITNPFWKGVMEGYHAEPDAPHINDALFTSAFDVDSCGFVAPNKTVELYNKLENVMPFFGFFGGGEYLSLFGTKTTSLKPMRLVKDLTIFGVALNGARDYSDTMSNLRDKKSEVWDGKGSYNAKRNASDTIQFDMDTARDIRNATVAYTQKRIEDLKAWWIFVKERNMTSVQAVDSFFSATVNRYSTSPAAYADTYVDRSGTTQVSKWVVARRSASVISALDEILSLSSIEEFEKMITNIVFLVIHSTGKNATMRWFMDSDEYLAILSTEDSFIARRESVRWSNVSEWEAWFESMVENHIASDQASDIEYLASL